MKRLFKFLHMDSYPKPNFDTIILITIQIAQGMGYLHAKNLIHKDLRSKNIFIDGNKAVISDFGLYPITKLCKKLKRKDLLPITKECLYYLAPELVRFLGSTDNELPFSQASDVFSFGTVCYELFCYEYPFPGYETDAIIFLVGNGRKHLSPNIQIVKELKNILLKCWSKDPSYRPNFHTLLEKLRALPKRKFYRSPSHPIY